MYNLFGNRFDLSLFFSKLPVKPPVHPYQELVSTLIRLDKHFICFHTLLLKYIILGRISLAKFSVHETMLSYTITQHRP